MISQKEIQEIVKNIAEKLGEPPEQITKYLETIKTKYCPPIYEATIKTIKQAKDTQTLKQEIKQNKPPIKTHLKTTNPKEKYIKLNKKYPKLK